MNSNNYSWIIPNKLKKRWYIDFLNLINQIDNSFYIEEHQREFQDEYIKSLIKKYIVPTYSFIDLITSMTADFDATTSTDWIVASNNVRSAYTTKSFGFPIDKIKKIKFFTAIRCQRYSGLQGGQVIINFKKGDDIILGSGVMDFNTDSYDSNWINCDVKYFDIEFDKSLINEEGEYIIEPLFRSKDGGDVRIRLDKTYFLTILQ